MESFQYEFFMSRIEHIRDIKENEKIKISLILYEGVQGPCIFKICKNRDLSDVCNNLKNVRHSNIAVIYDYLYADNNTYIIEEYIDGSTLKELLAENGSFSEKKTVHIMQEVCNGLEILHTKKPPIIHNDINTSNIMIRQDGSVKIFDFDISRTYKEGVSQNTRLFGTEDYAAPEHYGYGQSEPRTDIYSLGVTIHEMLTGKQLDNQHNVTYKGKLKKIITKCTQVDPKRRYSSITALKKDLVKLYDVRSKMLRIILLFLLLWLVKEVFSWGASHNEVEITQVNEERKQPSKEDDVASEHGSKEATNEVSEQMASSSDSKEDGQLLEESTMESSVAVDSESLEVPLKMSTVCEIDGKLGSMVALNDGKIVYLQEPQYDQFYLVDSLGQEKELRFSTSNFRLGYDGYKDALYLFADFGDFISVHLVDEELQFEDVATIRLPIYGLATDNRDIIFYSDGIMDISPNLPLIDTNTWLVVGESEDYDAIINDCRYNVYFDPANELYGFIQEMAFTGEVIHDYKIPEDVQTQSLENMPGYQDNEGFYFIGTTEGKQSVYRFDGTQIRRIVGLDDYRYYSEVSIGDWCVTEDKIWIYDTVTKTIKEFPRN